LRVQVWHTCQSEEDADLYNRVPILLHGVQILH
jgi:hypothetical protein